ncbi:heterokaryon incompatibility protein-domain-containing protein [Podospora didyma]|uniref:Heterokaryon incompatibility protein-domain-containing protein n=1 Tax=Podospora didyma TaxID=330526 RepID=A0AAE0NTG7_9PEZI|nr:heterokaryon incompatibility protein-domain-containing protein [Podospora didyma]
MGSLKSLEKARAWLSECNGQHGECPRADFVDLPTRLVQVSPPGSPSAARLRLTAGEKGRYATLSYCWGGIQPFQTVTGCLEQYLDELPCKCLPRTILDAFEVTRNLGLRYIWIDSLCIVQDDLRDKAAEIPMMLRRYEDCFVTISAGSAARCSEGFLNMGLNPINHRAWTLQESWASPRLLVFSGLAVIWKSELHWKALVEEYKRRTLTFAGDMLPAISAIAEKFAPFLGGRYLAGLWRDHLVLDLLGSCSGGYGQSNCLSPTWSWVSQAGRINFIDSGFQYPRLLPSAAIVDCSVVLASAAAPYGAVVSGEIVIEAFLANITGNGGFIAASTLLDTGSGYGKP